MYLKTPPITPSKKKMGVEGSGNSAARKSKGGGKENDSMNAGGHQVFFACGDDGVDDEEHGERVKRGDDFGTALPHGKAGSTKSHLHHPHNLPTRIRDHRRRSIAMIDEHDFAPLLKMPSSSSSGATAPTNDVSNSSTSSSSRTTSSQASVPRASSVEGGGGGGDAALRSMIRNYVHTGVAPKEFVTEEGSVVYEGLVSALDYVANPIRAHR